MDGDKQVAEICKEGFGRIPGQNGVTYQVVAVYPVGEDNKVDLANGYIAKYLGGAKGSRNIAGGTLVGQCGVVMKMVMCHLLQLLLRELEGRRKSPN